MKLVFATLLLLSLLFSTSFLEFTMAIPLPPSPAPAPSLKSVCDTKCEIRCSEARYKLRCMKYCRICCGICKCVPSGPHADKSECPCYRDRLNPKGNPKCP